MARTQVQLKATIQRSASFMLDRMEPVRPVVDRAILKLVKTSTFSGGDFFVQPDGVCRLNPQLARQVAQRAEQQVRGMRS
jgi:CRISPR/Cas system-associated endonuclease Cas1